METAYHCISRLVEGIEYLSHREKRHLVELMWRVSEFCGLEMLCYVVMGNHYHQLIVVPAQQDVNNAELLRRYEVLNGRGQGQSPRIRKAFEQGGADAAYWRKKLLARMGDISIHQKILKERFSKWYNHRKQRKGTLWSERFKSPVVELESEALSLVGAYIALNPVRAGLVQDPGEYEYSSYHAAIRGDRRCRRGIERITGQACWTNAIAQFRVGMACKGQRSARNAGEHVMDAGLAQKILERDGELPRMAGLWWRNRYLIDGVILGSRDFVEEVYATLSRGVKTGGWARKMRGYGHGKLRVLRNLRKAVYGFEE